MDFLKKNYFPILILIFSAIILSVNLNKPFVGHHDWNSVWYSNFARNFINHGFLDTKFGSVMNVGPVANHHYKYFTHYPPLLPILIALSFKIFGIHEWSARIVPLIFTLWTILMIYELGKRFFNKQIAILASVISVLLPITIYFGKMPVQEVLVIAPILLSVIFYFNFYQNHTKKNLIKLTISIVFSHLINWPAYYVTPLFFAHFILFSSYKKKISTALIFPTISILMFVLHSIHLSILTGNPLGGGMIQVLLFRLNLSEKPLDYTTLNFLKLQFHLLIAYFTKPVILLSAVTILWMISKTKDLKKSLQVQLLLMLSIFGIIHNAVFRNMAYIHDYMIIYLLPFIALSSSNGFFLVTKKLKVKSEITILIFCAVLFMAMFFESRNFVLALLKSNSFKDGYDLGVLINQKSEPKDKILILSPDFNRYFDVFVNYYSARDLSCYIPSYKEMQQIVNNKNYKLIIAIPSRDTPENLIQVLQNEYKANTIGKFIFFDTNDFNNYSGL